MSDYCEKHGTKHNWQRLSCPDCEHERLSNRITKLVQEVKGCHSDITSIREANVEVLGFNQKLEAQMEAVKPIVKDVYLDLRQSCAGECRPNFICASCDMAEKLNTALKAIGDGATATQPESHTPPESPEQ